MSEKTKKPEVSAEISAVEQVTPELTKAQRIMKERMEACKTQAPTKLAVEAELEDLRAACKPCSILEFPRTGKSRFMVPIIGCYRSSNPTYMTLELHPMTDCHNKISLSTAASAGSPSVAKTFLKSREWVSKIVEVYIDVVREDTPPPTSRGWSLGEWIEAGWLAKMRTSDAGIEQLTLRPQTLRAVTSLSLIHI